MSYERMVWLLVWVIVWIVYLFLRSTDNLALMVLGSALVGFFVGMLVAKANPLEEKVVDESV